MADDPKVKIVINKPALDKLAEIATAAECAATAINDAADKLTAGLPNEADVKRARRDIRAAGAAAWVSSLDRIFE